MTKYDKAFYANRQKERREYRKQHGLCLRCAGTLDHDSKRYCLECSRKNTARRKREEAKFMRDGLCRQCGKCPAEPNHVRCSVCLEKRRNNVHKAEITKLWHEQVRRDVLAAYGGKCTCCGESEPMFLEIDHVNGGGHKHRKEVSGGTAMYHWLKRNGYPQDEYQILCRNCNFGKYRNHGICPHQMRGTGTPGQLATALAESLLGGDHA